MFINNHSLNNGSQHIGYWLIDKQTGDPSIDLGDWPYDIFQDLEAYQKPDDDFFHDWYEENIDIIEELKTGNCLINGRGCFINSNGTSEYGVWLEENF